MSSTETVTDLRAAETQDAALGVPLLLVPILDGAVVHASVRQCVRAALSALDRALDDGVLLMEGSGSVELASGSAQRGQTDPLDRSRMRLQLASWHAGAVGTLIMLDDGSSIIIATTRQGATSSISEQNAHMAKLTTRERDVMRCVRDGLSNAEIARRLWIQPCTVRKHLENVFAKLQVRSRTAALSKLRMFEVEAS